MAKPQKVKLKKTAWIGIILTVIALVLFIILLIPTEKEQIYKTFQSNSDFKEDHIIDKVSFKKTKKLIEKSGNEKVYILMGTAEYFTDSIDVFNDVAKENEIKKLYWFDTNDSHIDENDEKTDFIKYIRSNVGVDSNNKKLVSNYTITTFAQEMDMIVAQNGKIIATYYDFNKKLKDSDDNSKSVEYVFKKLINA